MMTNLTALSRQSGSFIAGLLIGLAMVAALFAVTDPASGVWQTLLFYGAPAVLMLGLALQVVVVEKRRPLVASCCRAQAAGMREIWT
jgi:hypothetical protein